MACRMISIIGTKGSALQRLCRNHRVRRLGVFGSAADGTFDSERSDIDFLDDFPPFQPGTAFDTCFGLLEGAESILGRKIDLVNATCLTNPYFIAGVNESRKMVFEDPSVSETPRGTSPPTRGGVT